MAGSLDYSALSAVVWFITTQEKALDHDYEMPDTLVETGTYQGQTPTQLSTLRGFTLLRLIRCVSGGQLTCYL